MGRRADDPELLRFITGDLRRKVPDSMTASGSKYVVNKRRGVEFVFTHQICHEKCPPVRISKTRFVPYLGTVWLNENLKEEFPLGLRIGMTTSEIRGLLGPPDREETANLQATWRRVLDPERDVILIIDEGPYSITIDEALDVTPFGDAKCWMSGAMLAWAALRGLLNESKFVDHGELLAEVRRRERPGSELVRAALPGGLWDTHFKDEPGLRRFVHGWACTPASWARKIGLQSTIRNDVEKALGTQELAGDDWVTLSKLIPVFDTTFAKWVSK